MPDKRHWSAALAYRLANMAERLEERHSAISARDAADRGTAPTVVPPAASAPERRRHRG